MTALIAATLIATLGLGPYSAEAAGFELNLRLATQIGEAAAAQSAPVSFEAAEKASNDRISLKYSSELAVQAADATSTVSEVAEPKRNEVVSSEWLLGSVRCLWLFSALFLIVHIIREWSRVILVRLRRETKPLFLEHANWPVATILIVPKGDASTQEHRLDVLRNLPFDYPAERIHFVVAYHADDIALRDAIHRLSKALPERVQTLVIERGEDASLATLLPVALQKSAGSALVVLDQHLPVPRNWLKQSVSPLLDPAVGTVLNRAIPGQANSLLANRLVVLADHADVVLATQSDALDLMLCGKARLRSLRREAYKQIEDQDSGLTPDGASVVLELARRGWQAVLLADLHGTEPNISQDTIRSPRLHPAITLQAIRLAPLAIMRTCLRGARIQGRAVFFSAALPMIWLLSLGAGFVLYALGDIFFAGLAIILCATTSFDPLGHPKPAFSIVAAARMVGLREEIRLLPFACASFVDRMLEGCRVSMKFRPRLKNAALKEAPTVLPHEDPA